MRTMKKLADNSVVSIKTIFETQDEIRKSYKRQMAKLLSKYDSSWAKDECEVDVAKMTEADVALYHVLYEARKDASMICGKLLLLV